MCSSDLNIAVLQNINNMFGIYNYNELFSVMLFIVL